MEKAKTEVFRFPFRNIWTRNTKLQGGSALGLDINLHCESRKIVNHWLNWLTDFFEFYCLNKTYRTWSFIESILILILDFILVVFSRIWEVWKEKIDYQTLRLLFDFKVILSWLIIFHIIHIGNPAVVISENKIHSCLNFWSILEH